jgi:anti-sigma-K factor RskA
MSDIHALSGAYAVDALDDRERAEFEEHLAACTECRAEVASFHETVGLLAEAQAVAPPASLKHSVLEGIAQVRPLPPEAPTPRHAGAGTSADEVAAVRRRRLTQLLAAAAAVVLVAAGVVAWHPWQHDHSTLADRILHAPDAQRTTKHLPGGGDLVLVRSPALGRAVLEGHDVPDPGAGKTYQMWLQQPGQDMVSAGLMPDPDQPTVLTGDASTAAAAAVSVEPEGGSVHPSKDVVAVFALSPHSTGNGGT